jgi:hypothetical protein
MNPESIPRTMVFRCYGYHTRYGSWIASCIDLTLMVERPSMQESIQALHEEIGLYLESVKDIQDKESILHLLPRPAPWRERLFYQFIAIVCRFERICKESAFKYKEEYPIPQAA